MMRIFLVLFGAVALISGGHSLNFTRRSTTNLAEAWGLISKVDFSLPKSLSSQETNDILAGLDAKCLRDLLDVLNGTRNAQMWALKMIDSGTKIPSGIIEGNINDLGQFDECVNVERPNYLGQHCHLQFYVLQSDGTQSQVKFSMGISECVPSTCSADAVAALVNSILAPITKSLPPGYILYSMPPTCFTKEKPPMTTADWAVAIICIVIIIFAVLSTLFDIFLLKDKYVLTKSENIMRSFSIYTNGKKLLSTKSRNEMGVINGIKFFSMAWVVLGHEYVMKLTLPLVNLAVIPDYYKDWTKMMLLNATLSVDTFFFISGLLNAYGFFSMVNKKGSYSIFDVLLSYVHRYLRLTPCYALMIGLTATLFLHFGDGPMYSQINQGQADACNSYWWMDLLYINNYFSKGTCVAQGWYLGADMQMFWLSPLLLFPMWKWPIFGLIELIVLTLASIASPFIISYYYKWTSPIPVNGDPTRAALQNLTLYFPTHARLQTYIAGIAFGYLIYKVRSDELSIRINKVFNLIGWMISGAIMLYAIFGGYWFVQANNPYSQISSSFYLAFFRFIWVVGVGWVVFACVTERGGVINMLLSWKALWPLARLTYCVYLCHIAVLSIGAGMTRTALYMSDYFTIEQYFGDLFMSLCWAAILSLLVEAPTMTLEKILLGSLTKTSDSRREPTRDP